MSASSLKARDAQGKIRTIALGSGAVLARGFFHEGPIAISLAAAPSDFTAGDELMIKPAPGPNLPTSVYDLNIIDGIEFGTVKSVDTAHGRLTLSPREGGPDITVKLNSQSASIVHGRLASLRNVVTGQQAEVTGVINTRTHMILNAYSVIQD
jgi:hypothetical protein